MGANALAPRGAAQAHDELAAALHATPAPNTRDPTEVVLLVAVAAADHSQPPPHECPGEEARHALARDRGAREADVHLAAGLGRGRGGRQRDRTRTSFTLTCGGCVRANRTALATSSASSASLGRLSKNGVSTAPGSIRVTLMSVSATSWRSASPMAVTANFVAE